MSLYCFERKVQTCIRVVLCQTKKGLPACLALSMKSDDAFTSTGSKVVMLYFAFRNGRSCMLGTLDISAKGGSGPSSSIFCLPILPQRGITVESSASCAQQCTRLRGPYIAGHRM